MTLTILIATVPSRKHLVKKLITKLEKLIEGYDDIQIFCLYDNMMITTGAKRNKLMSMVDSAYVCYVDDDDMVSNDYIEEIYPHLKSLQYDIVSFNVHYKDDVGGDKIYDFSEYPPTHVHVRRTEKITRPFADIKTGEDRQWMLENSPNIGEVLHIPKVLYTYRFSTTHTEAQK